MDSFLSQFNILAMFKLGEIGSNNNWKSASTGKQR